MAIRNPAGRALDGVEHESAPAGSERGQCIEALDGAKGPAYESGNSRPVTSCLDASRRPARAFLRAKMRFLGPF